MSVLCPKCPRNHAICKLETKRFKIRIIPISVTEYDDGNGNKKTPVVGIIGSADAPYPRQYKFLVHRVHDCALKEAALKSYDSIGMYLGAKNGKPTDWEYLESVFSDPALYFIGTSQDIIMLVPLEIARLHEFEKHVQLDDKSNEKPNRRLHKKVFDFKLFTLNGKCINGKSYPVNDDTKKVLKKIKEHLSN